MRVVFAGVIASLLMAGSAVAQTEGTAAPVAVSSCGELPAQPALPDGAAADREAMEAGNAAYTAWSQAYHANLQCRRAEAESARLLWQAHVAAYNAGATALNQANTTWEADVAEYNVRNPARPARTTGRAGARE